MLTAAVNLDAAPTGRTLLLLDAAEAYHREVSRTRAIQHLLPRLRDSQVTKIVLVAVSEATQLQQDLRRAGIQPFAWIVNQR